MKHKFILCLASTIVLAACGQDQTQGDMIFSNPHAEEEASSEYLEMEETETPTQMGDEVQYRYWIDPNTFTVQPIQTDTPSKIALLTFDDAPYGNALKIADALEEKGLSAIFFVNSMYIEDEEGQQVVKELFNRGFEIGNHTHTHQTLTEASEAVQSEEILTANDKIEEITGVRPRFFRAPHGMITDHAIQVITDEGMQAMNWTFGYDWMPEYQEATALADIVVNTELLADGANILLHDRTWTADAIPEIIRGLESKGFEIIDPKYIDHKYKLEV